MISIFLTLLNLNIWPTNPCYLMPVYCFAMSSILSVQHWAVAVMACGLMVGILFPSWVPPGLTFWGCCNVIIWWLQQSLFTDLEGNSFHSCFQISSYHKPSTTLFLHSYSFFCFSSSSFWNKKHHSRTKALFFFYLNKEIYFYFPYPFLQITFILLSLHIGMFQLLYLKILTTYIRLSILWFGKCKYILYTIGNIFSHRIIFF